MPGKEITVLSWEMQSELTLDELCEACHVSHEFVQQLIEYGTIEPKGIKVEIWRFKPEHIRTVKTVIRLQHDLEVNLPGAVLVIDLLKQMEEMRRQLLILEKHVNLG